MRPKPSTVARLFLLLCVYLPSWFVHVSLAHGTYILPGGKNPILGMFILDQLLMVALLIGGIAVAVGVGLAALGEFDN